MYVLVYLWVSVREGCQLFGDSVVKSNVYGCDNGLLVKREGGPEVVPLRSAGETKCSVLDPLKF